MIEIPQPYLSLLQIEAGNSGRTVEAHISHIIGRRLDNIIRVCSCGYFLYVASDDLVCHRCAKRCCPYCSLPTDARDLCFTCAAELDIDTQGRGGFRAAKEGKV